MNQHNPMEENIYRWEGVFFNLGCGIALFIFILIFGADAIALINEEESTAIGLGLALVALTLAEAYVMPRKMQYVLVAIKKHHKQPSSIAFLLWLLHAGLSIMLVWVIYKALGGNIYKDITEAYSWWKITLIFGMLIKELYLLSKIWSVSKEDLDFERYHRPNTTEWFFDLILLIHTALILTVTWYAATPVFSQADIPSLAINTMLMSLIFLIFYLPLRLPYILEEDAQVDDLKGIAKTVLSAFLVLIPALIAKLWL